MLFIKIYIKECYINYYDTSIQMCGQYCILAPSEESMVLVDRKSNFSFFKIICDILG